MEGAERGDKSVSKGQFIASISLADVSRCLNHTFLDSRNLPLSIRIQSKEPQFGLKEVKTLHDQEGSEDPNS